MPVRKPVGMEPVRLFWQMPRMAKRARLASCGGYGAGELVVIDGKLPEIAELCELRGYCAGELVVVEFERFEAGELC